MTHTFILDNPMDPFAAFNTPVHPAPSMPSEPEIPIYNPADGGPPPFLAVPLSPSQAAALDLFSTSPLIEDGVLV